MIDIDALNRFLDEANAVIKNNGGSEGWTPNHDISKCSKLCSLQFSSNNESITFAIEARGFIRDEIVFFLVAQLNQDGDKFISRGHFTARGGHCASFAMTHDEPRGMNIQQGVLIEMRNLVERLNREMPSEFLAGMLDQLKSMSVKVVVVRSDEDALEKIAENPDFKDGAIEFDDSPTRGKLNIKGERMSEDEIKERVNSICNPEPVEDTIGETFAKNVGDKSEKPEEDNSIDDDMKSMQEYVIQKESFWTRLWKRIKAMFGIVSDSEALENLFDNKFNGKEDK